jgi:hypothetical protein
MPEHQFLTPTAVENPVVEYILGAALVRIETIASELEQCLTSMMSTVKAAELAITGFNAMTERLSNDSFLLSSTITSLSSSSEDKLGADCATISSIEFSVLMHEITEIKAHLSSLERGNGLETSVTSRTPLRAQLLTLERSNSGGD